MAARLEQTGGKGGIATVLGSVKVEGEEDSCLVGFSLARMILVARPCGKVGASVVSLANA
jgi:hypothetical protein